MVDPEGGPVTRVLCAMSGGVDSSVAAALLKEAGHALVGVTMHLWDAEGPQKVGRCCAPEDREDARRTCDHLGIPHYVFDEREAFRRAVVDPFVTAYRAGTTPSPCVRCNQEVKLARLLEVADELGCSHIATGHYARVRLEEGSPALLRGVDRVKDQSYFLYGVGREILSRLILPLGGLEKGTTRAEGRRLGVPNWDKKDSQELCFVPDGDVGGFVERETGERREGRVVDLEGRELAQHDGVYRFTVGQRRGLGVGGGAPPRYVLRIVPERDEVIVGPEEALHATEAVARDAVWIDELTPSGPFDAEVQVRSRHGAAAATVRPLDGGFGIAFHRPQRAIAPGQAAVVYRGERVIGGGVVATAG